MSKKYINILLSELNDVWSDKEDICFSGSSLSRLITELEEQQKQIDKLNKVANELHKKTRNNPEMWDTDGICFLIDEALAELKR